MLVPIVIVAALAAAAAAMGRRSSGARAGWQPPQLPANVWWDTKRAEVIETTEEVARISVDTPLAGVAVIDSPQADKAALANAVRNLARETPELVYAVAAEAATDQPVSDLCSPGNPVAAVGFAMHSGGIFEAPDVPRCIGSDEDIAEALEIEAANAITILAGLLAGG